MKAQMARHWKSYGMLVVLVLMAGLAGGLVSTKIGMPQAAQAQDDQPPVTERGLQPPIQMKPPGLPPVMGQPPPPPMMPPASVPYAFKQENAFLKLGNIKGRATTPQFINQIVFLSMSYGIQQAGEWEEGDRLSGRITTFADLTLVKEMDDASPSLAQACANKEQFPRAEIALVSGRDMYLRVTLEGVIVSSVSIGFHSGEARPMETVTLRYRKATWEWGAAKAGYDLRQNRKV